MPSKKIYTKIIGTGSFVPENIVKNESFLNNEFFEKTGDRAKKENSEIIEKFLEITEIEERRYADKDHKASDLGYFSAVEAIKNSGIDPELLDYIIVAHNFGDVCSGSTQVDIVPSIAAKVKHMLGIKNPYTVAYDLPFGCPGWVQGVIQADYFIKSGDAKYALVIGAETLSRVADPHDIDSMIYSDGAGAVVLEGIESEKPIGLIAHKTRSDTEEHYNLLWVDKSNNPQLNDGNGYIKMVGRRVYEYAITKVPHLVKETLDKAGLHINDVNKILIHQANGKMDYVIAQRTFKQYGIITDVPQEILPMNISKLGNNSVATVPILLDMILQGQMENQLINSGDVIVFASVGAGMNINAFAYKWV
jgi:3-oxoacyl-[acyl-carrier-protein] synthase-3